MSFDISKPYRCKSGWKAVVIAAPNGRLYGYVGQRLRDVEYAEGCEWNSDGRCLDAGRSGLDLVNIPEKRTLDVWVNIYDSAVGGSVSNTQEEADAIAKGVKTLNYAYPVSSHDR